MSDSLDTTQIGACLARLRAGDAAARDELIRVAAGRLERLARRMLRNEFKRVGRWLDTGDVLQNSIVRLWKALAAVTPESPLHFHRLAAQFVRRELIDLARRYYGPHGLGANHESYPGAPPGFDAPATPDADAGWVDVHSLVQTLPEDEAAVTDLLFYQGLSPDEAAALLGTSLRTVHRRWQRARRALGARLADEG